MRTCILLLISLLALVPAAAQAQGVQPGWLVDGVAAPPLVEETTLHGARLELTLAADLQRPPQIALDCRNPATGETGVTRLAALGLTPTDDGARVHVDLTGAWLGLPYPVDPWALESKPMAIISGRAGVSPMFMPQATLRDEFAWTRAYMLETARHSYDLPLGDGLLECQAAVALPGASQPLRSAPLAVQFGRGLPAGVYARDFTRPLPAASAWVTDPAALVVAAPPDDAATRAELDTLRALASNRTTAQLDLIRQWDDGSAVGPWVERAMDAVIAHNVNPPRAARIYGYISVAMYEAALAADHAAWQYRRPAPCALEPALNAIGVDCATYAYPSDHAAVAGAASAMLAHFFPDSAGTYAAWVDEALQTRLWAAASYPSDLDAGRALGEQVAARLIARARADGSDAVFSGDVPTGARYWQPDLPDMAGPQEPLAGTWQPWNLTSGDQFRPGPPPLPGSPRFEAELREVYEVASNLTIEEQELCSFWEDKKGTYTPPGHWNQIALELVREHGLSTADAARVFAALNSAQADAFIAAWDAKYAYWSVRPITAIRRDLDPDWLPYIYTPPFPSYVSGHATTSGAASTVLAAFFPDHVGQLHAWAEDAAYSRLLGGIHFRTDNEVGLALGRQVAGAALAHFRLQPAPAREL